MTSSGAVLSRHICALLVCALPYHLRENVCSPESVQDRVSFGILRTVLKKSANGINVHKNYFKKNEL